MLTANTAVVVVVVVVDLLFVCFLVGWLVGWMVLNVNFCWHNLLIHVASTRIVRSV